MAIEKTVVIIVEGEDAIKEVQKLNDQLADTQARLDAIEKDAGKGFDGAAKGAGKFKTAINAVGTALKAAGIGLVLAALVKITDVFKNSPQGARIISRALNTVNIVMLELYHNAAVLGDLLSALFRGDFVAVGALSAAFKEQIGNALDLGEAYTNLGFAVKALDDSLILITSRQLRIMEQNRVIADNDQLSAEKRIAAANNIEEAAKTLFNAQTVRYNKELEQLNILDVLNAEQVTRKFELLAEIEAGEEEYNARLAELLSIRRGFYKETTDEIVAGYKDVFSKDGLFGDFITEAIDSEGLLTDAVKAGADERMRIREIEQDARVQTQYEYIDSLNSLGRVLGSFAEDNKALAVAALLAQQIAAVANVIVSGIQARAGVVAHAAIKGGAVGVAAVAPLLLAMKIADAIGVAAIIASTVGAVGKIGGGSGSGSSSSVPSGGSGGSAPAPSFNVVGASQSSSLEQTLLSQGVRVSQDTPIKSYVVASDVTTMQSLDRQVEANAGV